MKTHFVINTNSDYIAFASQEAGSIAVYGPSQTIGVDSPQQTLTLSRSGSDTQAPFTARLGTTTEGTRFVATVPVAAWYQPNTVTGAADEDETLLFGF